MFAFHYPLSPGCVRHSPPAICVGDQAFYGLSVTRSLSSLSLAIFTPLWGSFGFLYGLTRTARLVPVACYLPDTTGPSRPIEVAMSLFPVLSPGYRLPFRDRIIRFIWAAPSGAILANSADMRRLSALGMVPTPSKARADGVVAPVTRGSRGHGVRRRRPRIQPSWPRPPTSSPPGTGSARHIRPTRAAWRHIGPLSLLAAAHLRNDCPRESDRGPFIRRPFDVIQ